MVLLQFTCRHYVIIQDDVAVKTASQVVENCARATIFIKLV